MCGIVGIAGDLDYKAKNVFRDLLIVDSLRGTHGTGVFSVGSSSKDTDWIKRAGDVYGLVDQKGFDKTVTVSKRILVGHNRYGTIGAPNTNNAHPFDFDNVIGVHNGTIHYPTRNKLLGYSDFDTDSEALYNTINSALRAITTYPEALKSVFGELDDGAWSVVMFLKKHNKLVFLRNKERPMHYAYTKDKKAIVFASEAWMIYGCCNRNDVDLEGKVKALSEDVITAFHIPYAGAIQDPERTLCPMKEKAAYSFQSGKSYSGWTPQDSRTATSHTSNVRVLPGAAARAFPNEHKKGGFKPPYKDYMGRVLTKPQFDELIEKGETCCYCNGHTPTWGEEVCFLRPTPVGEPAYACKSCVNDPEIMDILRALR